MVPSTGAGNSSRLCPFSCLGHNPSAQAAGRTHDRTPLVLHLPPLLPAADSTVIQLSLGLVLFFLPHLLREFGWRDRLVAALPSEGAYKGLYSLVALAGLVLIVIGKGRAEFIMVWQPLFAWRWLSHLVMLPAFVLVVAGNLPMSHLRRELRHPMLLGVCLWGIAHLWANGDLASMLMFGGFTLWAGFKFIFLTRTRPVADKPPRLAMDIAAIVVGVIAYGLVFYFHGELFGMGLAID